MQVSTPGRFSLAGQAIRRGSSLNSVSWSSRLGLAVRLTTSPYKKPSVTEMREKSAVYATGVKDFDDEDDDNYVVLTETPPKRVHFRGS